MDDQFEHEQTAAGQTAADQTGAELDALHDARLNEIDSGVTEQGDGELPGTGNDIVDGVIGSLDGLDDRPVDEHVPVFEHAHEQLRSALDNPRED